ncbi:uroporphyrinogen decarboxylase family protein [Desulfitibacter alkalitolerans]|uniref:uroporphyrinogen decarboxylase family protein n=1 Tax=Desulfitibacter alkalitolerans TaxID=264641 RepID=UPI0006847D7F|nr:uroporphyrinogen decarboxylase family protein [Desulfitibacter alkalitolerans]
MKSVELITKKLAGEKTEYRAKGEFFIEKGIAKELTGHEDRWLAKRISAELLGFNYIAEGVDKSHDGRDHWGRLDFGQRGYEGPIYDGIENLCNCLKVQHVKFDNLSRWKKETDFFVFALIDGPFQTLSSLLDYNQFLMDTMMKPDLMEKGVEAITREIITIINIAVSNGADGVILGEDIAYSKGLIVSPKIIRSVFLPRIQEIAASTNKPVVFHSDGNLTDILPDIAKTGIAGIHSIEENSNMDLKSVRKAVGDNICLLGGFDLNNFYEYEEEELIDKVRGMIALGQDCEPYIFGTSAGIIDDNLPLEKVKLVYQTVSKR